mmetsp:Transcript_16000/g.52732  ORF Transcript_16000/g.52732 Transcript_16000/m.52732 type:complete len:235 (+) Transcript_16000:76-780(+)
MLLPSCSIPPVRPLLLHTVATSGVTMLADPALATSSAADLPATSFEPQGDPLQAAILFSVVALPFAYWWYISVPEARLALAKDKRIKEGETKRYLDELADDPSGRKAERWFFAKWLRQNKPSRPAAAKAAPEDEAAALPPEEEAAALPPAPPPEPARDLLQSPRLGVLFKPASLKGNATPKFWSGDNPIVVTMGGLALAGVVATAAQSGSGALVADVVVLGAGLAFGLSRLTLD